MCTRPYCLAALLFIAAQSSWGQLAPDRSLQAQVHRARHVGGDRIEVTSIRNGKQRWTLSAGKLSVEQIAWTPDSQFLVWSGVNAAGHQPWHHPVHAWSRNTGRVVALEDFLPGPADAPQFTLTPPATLTVSVQDHISTELDLTKLPPRKP